MIVVTGAAGFIASFLCEELNAHGYQKLILVDDFSNEAKQSNHNHLQSCQKIDHLQVHAVASEDRRSLPISNQL